MGDDRLGLRRSFLLLTLIGGEGLLRLVAQVARCVELLPDAPSARIERADNGSPHRFPDDDNKDRDGQEDIELRIAKEMGHQLARSPSTRSTAAARLAGSAGEPITFSVTE